MGTFKPSETVSIMTTKTGTYNITITATNNDGKTTSIENAKKIAVTTSEAITSTQPIREIQKETSKQIATDGEWWIPKGFREATDSALTIKEGKVIEDESGNQFVWVPCYVEGGVGQEVLSATEYKRTDFGKIYGNGSYSNYSEELDENDSNSVKKYGGFYIGRYEAGAETAVSSADTTRKVLIQKNKKPYNWIHHPDSATKSSDFASDNNYDKDKIYTKLVSSYAWDTAICFIQKTVTDYGTNSKQGNYSDHKYSDTQTILNTGLTIPVCNIYDMGGNLLEHTSGRYSTNSVPYDSRGGYFKLTAVDAPAGFRWFDSGNATAGNTFRITMYIK